MADCSRELLQVDIKVTIITIFAKIFFQVRTISLFAYPSTDACWEKKVAAYHGEIQHDIMSSV